MKAEVVSRELLYLCYGLLEHLLKTKKCCYIAESIKVGRYNTTVVIRYMSTKDGKQIHELDEKD